MPDEMHVDWVRQKMREITKDTSDKPFFLGVGFVKPHTPLYAPQRYFDMFPLDKIKLPEIKEGDLDDTGYESVYAPSEMGLKYYRRLKESYPGDEGLKRFLQAYLACLAFVDDQIGGVLDALEEHGLAENTTVIFTSDHGWQMGEKDYLYKNSLWDESTRVPFIIKRPDTEPRQITHAVSLIDVFPTVVDLFGLAGGHSKGEKAASLGGHSLVPFLEGEPDNWQGPDGALTIAGAWINKPIEGIGKAKNPHAPWHITISQDLDTGYVRKQHFSYRTERYRYIRYGNGQEELYDHQNDPLEWTNQAQNPDYEAIRSSLHQEMMALINPKAK
jgi:iduronate 2-sulfatase